MDAGAVCEGLVKGFGDSATTLWVAGNHDLGLVAC